MGNRSSWLGGSNSQTPRVLMIGLDGAGKTTMLDKWGLGDPSTIPTIGCNIETVQYKGVSFICWDVGSEDQKQEEERYDEKEQQQNTTGLIFVVDSNDRQRISEAETVLKTFLSLHYLAILPCLIFVNKQDLPNAMSVLETVDRLGLYDSVDINWYGQPTCATSGDGLSDGLDWLFSAIHPNRAVNVKAAR